MNSTQPINVGQNISNSIYVLKETYRNLNLLFTELDRTAEKEGFLPLSPKFLRYKSDSNSDGWLTENFIKLYQEDKNPPLKHLETMKNGDVFGIEIDLKGEGADSYPTISLTRFQFDLSQWNRLPSPSDHWIFYHPFRLEKHFDIDYGTDLWISKTIEKSKLRYWGLESAASIEIPLLSIVSEEDIKSKIFSELTKLPRY